MRFLSLQLSILGFGILLGAAGLCGASEAGHNPKEALGYLLSLKEQNGQKLIEIDRTMKESLSPKTPEQLERAEAEVNRLGDLREEYLLRQNFLDRLIFQVDTHYRGGDLKAFLKQRTKVLAEIEVKSTDSDRSLWKFLTYLSLALNQTPEKDEDVLEFIEGYMKASGIRNPIPPTEYLAKRNYTNGTEAMMAAKVSKENLGELVEKQLSLLDQKRPTGSIELNQDVLKSEPERP